MLLVVRKAGDWIYGGARVPSMHNMGRIKEEIGEGKEEETLTD